MALELTDELLVVEVPYRNGSITTAAKAGLEKIEKEGKMVREGRREEGERAIEEYYKSIVSNSNTDRARHYMFVKMVYNKSKHKP